MKDTARKKAHSSPEATRLLPCPASAASSSSTTAPFRSLSLSPASPPPELSYTHETWSFQLSPFILWTHVLPAHFEDETRSSLTARDRAGHHHGGRLHLLPLQQLGQPQRLWDPGHHPLLHRGRHLHDPPASWCWAPTQWTRAPSGRPGQPQPGPLLPDWTQYQ